MTNYAILWNTLTYYDILWHAMTSYAILWHTITCFDILNYYICSIAITWDPVCFRMFPIIALLLFIASNRCFWFPYCTTVLLQKEWRLKDHWILANHTNLGNIFQQTVQKVLTCQIMDNFLTLILLIVSMFQGILYPN